MNDLELIRTLILRRRDLENNISSQIDEGRLYELNEIIDFLKNRVDATLKRQPKLNKIVLYLYYYKLYSWEEIMRIFEIDSNDKEQIEKMFHEDFFQR